MTFGQSYLKHLEVLQNIGMTSITPVMYNGVEVIPCNFKIRSARPIQPRAFNQRQNLYWLCGQRH